MKLEKTLKNRMTNKNLWPNLFSLLLLSFGTLTLNAQDHLVFSPLTVNATLQPRDSILTLTYTTDAWSSYLLWTGDFTVAAITTQSDVSGEYLGSPIANEIFFIDKRITGKQSDRYFLRKNASESNLYNYQLINAHRPAKVRIKIANGALFRLLTKKQLKLHITATLINFNALEQAISLDSTLQQQWLKELINFKQFEVNTDPTPVTVSSVQWSFGRLPEVSSVNREAFIPEDLGDLSQNIFMPDKSTEKQLVFPVIHLLYQFSNKFFLQPELRIIR